MELRYNAMDKSDESENSGRSSPRSVPNYAAAIFARRPDRHERFKLDGQREARVHVHTCTTYGSTESHRCVHTRGVVSIERARGWRRGRGRDDRKPGRPIDTPTDHGQIDITGVQLQIDLLVERVLALLVEVLPHQAHGCDTRGWPRD